MKTRRNTAAMPTDAEAKRRLQKLIDRLPLPPGANATVISARVRPYEYSGDYHDEEGHTLEYEVGGHTDLDADSALARYRDHDLHRIVSDALGVRRGDEEALLEDTDVLRDSRTLRDYPGFSVIWSGTLLDRAVIHTDDGDKRADAVPEVRAGKRNAGFMQKLLADVKTNPRRSERGGPKRGYLETRRPLSKVPLTSSVFDKENWFVGYANERAKSGVPFMDRAFLHLHAGNWTGREEQGTVYLDVPLAWDKPIPTRIGTFHAANITSVSFYYTPRTNSLLVTYDLDFDAERNHSALRAVVYGPQPRTLRRGTRIIEEHPRGPRGLEEAVRMARKDFEGRMVDGTIKVGTPRYGFTETPKVLLSAEETRELLAARKEAMRADDEGYAFVHKLPQHMKELLIIMRPDLNGDFGPVYRDEVDAVLAWYRSLSRQNPRARRVSTAVLGERVRVFRNLHTETWSVESATTGRIIAHPDTVLLEDVRLVSRDAGREKTRRTGKKGVHAVASGTLVAIDGPAPADLARWTPLYYNPFKVDTFVEFVDGKVGKPVRGARMWFAAADHRSQYALAPQEADPGRYKKPKVPKRRNPDEDDFDAEYWDEQLQEMCESTDYSLLQEGDDIGHFDRYGGRGYHETSPKRAEDIKKEGLGHHPGLSLPGGGGIEGHETNLWMCAWADPSLAARLLARGREGDWRWEVADRIADDLSKHLVQKFPDLKVVWFYKDAKGKGLSKYSGAKCSFDLREVVEWLATNAEDGPYLYGDEYMGYCLSWRGPRIPPSFLRWEQQNPRAHRAAPVPKRANGLLASLALVGIGMVAGVYVEEQKGVAARVRRALKGKDKVAREQFDRLKRDVLAAKPRGSGPQERVPLAIRTSTPITVRSSIVEAVTDPAWVREESPDGKGYIHVRTMKGTPYEVFERVYGKGNKLVVLDVGEAHERVNAPNGKDGWPSVAAAKRAAEALAGMRLASA